MGALGKCAAVCASVYWGRPIERPKVRGVKEGHSSFCASTSGKKDSIPRLSFDSARTPGTPQPAPRSHRVLLNFLFRCPSTSLPRTQAEFLETTRLQASSLLDTLLASERAFALDYLSDWFADHSAAFSLDAKRLASLEAANRKAKAILDEVSRVRGRPWWRYFKAPMVVLFAVFMVRSAVWKSTGVLLRRLTCCIITGLYSRVESGYMTVREKAQGIRLAGAAPVLLRAPKLSINGTALRLAALWWGGAAFAQGAQSVESALSELTRDQSSAWAGWTRLQSVIEGRDQFGRPFPILSLSLVRLPLPCSQSLTARPLFLHFNTSSPSLPSPRP